MRWSGGDEGAIGGNYVDDDLGGARRDDDYDGNDFSLREGVSSIDFCLLESFLLSVWFPPRVGGRKLI